jgi:hypothetical protein
MARARVRYSTWSAEALHAERERLRADTAPAANRAQIGHITKELARRAALPPADSRHLVSGWWLEHAGPPRKPDRVLSVLREVFQVRDAGGAVVEDHLPAVLGYDSPRWLPELSRRAGVTADRGRLMDIIQREEFQHWERTFAQRVADERAAGARSDLAAARIVAKRQEAALRSLLVDEASAVRPGMEAAWARLDACERDGYDLHGKLTRAIYDVTRQWRANTRGTGKRAVPEIRGRVRDPARSAEFREVVRAALRDAPAVVNPPCIRKIGLSA